MTKKEQRIEEAKAKVERVAEEAAQTALKFPDLESKEQAYAYKRFDAARRLHQALLLDAEDTLILEELALVKAEKAAELHCLSFGAGIVLEFAARAHARGMTEDEFFNSDKPEEAFYINEIRGYWYQVEEHGDFLKKTLGNKSDPESLEAGVEQVKEAELWPWDFKQ